MWWIGPREGARINPAARRDAISGGSRPLGGAAVEPGLGDAGDEEAGDQAAEEARGLGEEERGAAERGDGAEAEGHAHGGLGAVRGAAPGEEERHRRAEQA